MPTFSDKALDPEDQLIPNTKGAQVQLWAPARTSSLLRTSPGQGRGEGATSPSLGGAKGRRGRAHTPLTHVLANSQAHPQPQAVRL